MKTPPTITASRSDVIWYFITSVFFVVLVSIAGFALIQQQKRLLLHEKQKELSTIADLKTTQLVQWRKERFAEAASIRANAMMSHRISRYLDGTERAEVHAEVVRWMANLVDLGEYSSAVLFTPDGETIAATKEPARPLSPHYTGMIAEAATEHEIILSDFHTGGASDPYGIDMVIPIMQFNGGRSHCIAVLLLDIDTAKRLYPLIKSWPASDETAETLLVRREGDAVLFLNELRHRTSTGTPFILPLTEPDMPAVRAARGEEGIFEGIDYRTVAVLSAIRVVPGTQWGVVAKIDRSEVLAPLSKSIWYVVLSGIFVVSAMIMGLFLWGQRRKAESLRRMVEIEQKHNLELKKSEDSLTRSRDYHLQLLEIIPSLIWRSGTDARCDYFNQTWLAFTGRHLEQELGDGWAEGVHPDDLERCVAFYREAFQAQRPFTMEYRLRFHDGSYHWINDNGSPYYDPNGVFAGYIGSCYDINHQKTVESDLHDIHDQLEQQIIDRTRDLTEINSFLRLEMAERQQLEQQLLTAKRLEAIGQIAGGVAHEVRNPLNAILTITEALFREKEIEENPEFQPYIQHIRTQVNRLAQLMNDLLDLGRTIPATNLQPLPLFQLCRETLDLWKSTGMSRNKHGILTSDNDDISILVLADGLKLQQVFFNLLENAGHHAPDDSRIVIRLVQNIPDLPPGMAAVQVIDQGTGIAEENLPHVFDPFYTERKGGTGLGLALVKHFTENMRGTVQIRNNSPQPGCTVEVRIPLYREDISM